MYVNFNMYQTYPHTYQFIYLNTFSRVMCLIPAVATNKFFLISKHFTKLGLTSETQPLMNKLHNTVCVPVESELLQMTESIEWVLFIQSTHVFAWVLACFGQRPAHCLLARPILAWYEWRLAWSVWINHPGSGANASQQEIMWMSLHV